MKSQVLHTVWCNMTGEATGEIWTWSLSGVKGITVSLLVWHYWKGCRYRHLVMDDLTLAQMWTCKASSSSKSVVLWQIMYTLPRQFHAGICDVCVVFCTRLSEKRTIFLIGVKCRFRYDQWTPRKYVFNVISVGQRSSQWTCNSVKVEIKFHLECKLHFPSA